MSNQLALALREGTKKAHTMAENVGFVRCFLKGVVEKQSYRKLVANFYFVYGALETAMAQHREQPVLGPLYFPELLRQPALERDLTFYYGAQWREEIRLSAAGQTYVNRIEELARTQPELLVAHAYTRYLGDLSGGQILKKIAQNAMNLGEEGVAFYRFEQIPDEKAFKVQYRQILDTLPVDEAMVQAIVQEANAAFGLNMKMFQELEGNLVKAIGIMLYNTITRGRQKGSTDLAPATE
ncbi:Heme oxygenase superfamily [Gloeomargarita lithophora Alchichica-D10]|uniref:heme oxygenase (biliverdin-producing) n=1 Tax=Gloeomargarita lithophora Alchichica-D10 TaxID=1188229 RepID=A0A1J0AGT2_9CYAN|nr:heme oxygenase (biliverdin-producing) [Gloeomargarita lithophora]APB35112.1 Heme oxygenase superfamily [Gloeomargarita lithophora Alchichica-D10]